MAHKTMKSLLDTIDTKARKSLKQNVFPLVRDEMISQIKSEVYGVYKPIKYIRKYTFRDDRNVFIDDHYEGGKLTNGETIMVSISHQDPRDITKLVILGQEGAKANHSKMLYSERAIHNRKMRYLIEGKTDEKAFWEPRDFIDTTKTAIQADRVNLVNAFKKGMK